MLDSGVGESPYLHVAAGVIRLVVARSLGSHSKSEPEEQAVLHGSNLRESGAHDTALWRDGSGGSSQS